MPTYTFHRKLDFDPKDLESGRKQTVSQEYDYLLKKYGGWTGVGGKEEAARKAAAQGADIFGLTGADKYLKNARVDQNIQASPAAQFAEGIEKAALRVGSTRTPFGANKEKIKEDLQKQQVRTAKSVFGKDDEYSDYMKQATLANELSRVMGDQASVFSADELKKLFDEVREKNTGILTTGEKQQQLQQRDMEQRQALLKSAFGIGPKIDFNPYDFGGFGEVADREEYWDKFKQAQKGSTGSVDGNKPKQKTGIGFEQFKSPFTR